MADTNTMPTSNISSPQQPSTSSSASLSLPTDGFGGSLYYKPFDILLYASPQPSPTNQTLFASALIQRTTSFHTIDVFVYSNALGTTIYALTFGLCILTLLNTLVLTPTHKRRMPIFFFLTFGLIAQLARCICSLWLITAGPSASSYLALTRDWADTVLSRRFRTAVVLDHTFAVFAGIAVQACLFIQARCLLSVLRLRYRRWIYLTLLSALTLLGVAAVVLRIVFAAWQIRYFAFAADALNTFYASVDPLFALLHASTVVAYAVSIGAWSLVFVASAVNVLRTRSRLLRLSGTAWYDAALSFIALVGVESFIIPVILCVLQFIPSSIIWVNLETCIVPVVLSLLPMGSLFLSHSSNDEVVGHRDRGETTVSRGEVVSNHSFTICHSEVGRPATIETTGGSAYIDRQLSDIDAML